MQYREHQQGVTLIEVMVGIVLTSILILGLSGLWSMVHKQFRNLTIKQKAVFVLSGEMERLATFYTWNDMDDSNPITITSDLDADRLMYNKLNVPHNIISTSSDFENGEVYFFDSNDIPGAEDRNVVWIDREDNITGILSWSLESIGVAGTNDCFASGTLCQELTLYLRYPYRSSNASPINSTLGIVREMSLKTIVRRRE